MKQLSSILAYLRQPIPAPWWIVCALTKHRWDAWEDMLPGSAQKHRRMFRCCARCDAIEFVTIKRGRHDRGTYWMRVTWQALLAQWLCAARPGGHTWPEWMRMRRQTDVPKGVHRRTLGRQCDHCARFETKVEEQPL